MATYKVYKWLLRDLHKCYLNGLPKGYVGLPMD